MQTKLSNCLLIILCLLVHFANAQQLKPGFDKGEYINLMKVSAQVGDSAYTAATPAPQGFRQLYRSPALGLDNLWDLWMTTEQVPVISIRGTTRNEMSWMANFYGAMVAAKGQLRLSKTQTFDYQLAVNPAASVHVGWLVSMAFLATDMMPKIDSLYKAGRKDMYIIGHSQGGGIAYLLTAYFLNLQKMNKLPADLKFKTYCSAAPKPGNLYFAHEYEAMTQMGWAFNVVNSADWVPETMVSIQTADDFNSINPFVNVKGFISKQSFIKRIALNHAYKKLTKHNRKAAENYRKYLGSYVAKSVKKHLPGFEEPAYVPTNNYVRTGNTITLLADEAYFAAFPQDPKNIFINHFHPPYLYLVNKLE